MDARARAQAILFGPQPVTRTADLVYREEQPDGAVLEARVPVTFRAIDRQENFAIQRACDQIAGEAERDVEYTTQFLLHSLVRVGDLVLPTDHAQKRALLVTWKESAVARLAEMYLDLDAEMRGAVAYVRGEPDPKGSGATTSGPASAPKAAGPAAD